MGPHARLSTDDAASRVSLCVCQVNDCLSRYDMIRGMSAQYAQLKREGKPVPKTAEEVQAMLGELKHAQRATETS